MNSPSVYLKTIANEIIPFSRSDLADILVQFISQSTNIDKTQVMTDWFIDSIYCKLLEINTVTQVEDQIVYTCSNLKVNSVQYERLAVHILISRLHANTHEDYQRIIDLMMNNTIVVNKGIKSMRIQSSDRVVQDRIKKAPLIDRCFYEFVSNNIETIQAMFEYSRDYCFSLFGFRTLEKAYLKRAGKMEKIIERPQHMYMRVAIELYYRSGNFKAIKETYDYLSLQLFVHATPTLFNAGTGKRQLASCFLMSVSDTIESLYGTLMDAAIISKYAGGIGIGFSRVRAKHSYINGTNGTANGLECLKPYNDTADYCDQGGKRPGSFVAYIEPWHNDMHYFLDLRKNTGDEANRARSLFTGLMINDVFMERVKHDEMWSLMCPDTCPKLVDLYGDAFTRQYAKYESKGMYIRQVRALELWNAILLTMIRTGLPYIKFKDNVNAQSNQMNVGTIVTSNLCAEIDEYTSDDEIAVCNLVSICLPKFIIYDSDGVAVGINHPLLKKVAGVVTRNLNIVIDINFYPVAKAQRSNLRHRPIGVGIQGLADVFQIFNEPFDSPRAIQLQNEMMETIYYGCMCESHELAKIHGPYETYKGSPISQGKFQFDLLHDALPNKPIPFSGLWDWEELRHNIINNGGVRNSLVTTCMPTASTSQLNNNNECFEPFTDNIYTRETNAGEHYVVNQYLQRRMTALGIWTDNINQIKLDKGSVKNVNGLSDHDKLVYRTAWEIDQLSLVRMAHERAYFISQSQSLNIFYGNPTIQKLNTVLFTGYNLKAKNGCYYTRTRGNLGKTQFTVIGNGMDKLASVAVGGVDAHEAQVQDQNQVCRLEPGCLSCGS